jgi:hypothetical protein
VLLRLGAALFPLALASRLRSNLMGWGHSSVSWLSEIAHDQGKVTFFAAISGMIVDLTGAGVAVIIGWRLGTSSRLARRGRKSGCGCINNYSKSERTRRPGGR